MILCLINLHEFLQLKCAKEYELVKLNDSKLLDLWRPRLRKLKKTELLDDYEVQYTFSLT